MFSDDSLCGLSQISGFLKPRYLDCKMDMKVMKVVRKARESLLTLKNMFRSLGPNKLLLTLVLRSQQPLQVISAAAAQQAASGFLLQLSRQPS